MRAIVTRGICVLFTATISVHPGEMLPNDYWGDAKNSSITSVYAEIVVVRSFADDRLDANQITTHNRNS